MKPLAAIATAVTLVLGACSGSSPGPTAGEPGKGTAKPDNHAEVPTLDPAGWTTTVYQTLTRVISGSAGQDKIAVFDFDNTTQARDIGEAVLALMQQTGALDPAALSPAMFPSFTASDGTPVSISRGVFDYYEAVLDSGGDADPFREYSSLPMPGSVFYGRTVADFVVQTSATYDYGSGAADLTSKNESKILGAGLPFIYPQMADLYGNLRRHGYDVWVVSAGIAWAVRWMVQNALNPAIVAKYGKDAASGVVAARVTDAPVSGARVSDADLAGARVEQPDVAAARVQTTGEIDAPQAVAVQPDADVVVARRADADRSGERAAVSWPARQG